MVREPVIWPLPSSLWISSIVCSQALTVTSSMRTDPSRCDPTHSRRRRRLRQTGTSSDGPMMNKRSLSDQWQLLVLGEGGWYVHRI